MLLVKQLVRWFDQANNIRKKSILSFSLLFWIIFIIILYRHVDGNTMALAGTDGVQQHYPVMVFIGRYIRQVFENLCQGVLTFPLVNYEIGMGDDIITALNYYGFGDPFYLLAAFFSEAAMPWFYTALFYMRIYLGGIAFIFLAHELVSGKSTLAYVAGAFLYCFSGFTFEANVHIIFVQAMMYIPLMLYAAERILEKKRWGRRVLFLTTLGLGCSGFFFTYIGVITTALYTLFRAWQNKRKSSVGKSIIRVGLPGALGLGASAIIFVPSVLGFINSSRSGGSLNVPLFYEMDTYKSMFFTFFMGKELHRSIFAFPIVGAVALILVVSAKGCKKEKRVVFGCFLGYLFPIFSWIGTGFSATLYDRWEIVLVIGVSLVFISIWNNIFVLTGKQMLCLCLFYAIIIFLGVVDNMFSDRCYRNMFLAFTGCMVFFGGGVLFPVLLSRSKKEWIWFILTIGCVLLSWWTMKVDYPIEAVQRDTAVEKLVDDNSFFRVENEETFMGVVQINLALAQDYYSTAEYVSIENPIYVQTMNDDWRLAMSGSFASSGLDRRTMLESMSGVKYMLVRGGHEYLVPYGFVYDSETEDNNWRLYKNQYAVPIAYTYDKVLNYEDYLELDALEKQMAICQVAAVKDYNGSVESTQKFEKNYTTEECHIKSVSEIVYSPDIYSVQSGKRIELSVPIKEKSETYVLIQDEDANGVQEIRWKDSSLSPYMRNDTPNFINLGYFEEEGELLIEVTIDSKSSFNAKRIMAAHVSMVEYEAWMEERTKEFMLDAQLKVNRIEGSIEVSEDRILCTTIPYLKGWKAFVDGEEVPLYQINSLFMGIEIPEGTHSVLFSYCTPGLAVGELITMLSMLAGLVWYCVSRMKCSI